jgi:hypothetical protein
MKKLPFLLLLFLLLASCKGKVACTDETPLAVGDRIRVTVGDYRYAEKLLKEKARRYFSKHRKELLERIVNRRLVLRYIEDSTLKEKAHLKEKMEEFKKEYLARYFVSVEAQRRAEKVTDSEVISRFKELFPGKDPKNMSEGDRKFIRNELKVKKYSKAVKAIYAEVEKAIKFTSQGNRITASYDGVSVEANAGEKGVKRMLKEKLITEYFYRKATERGYDKDKKFQKMLTEYTAEKAISILRKELEKNIEVTDSEITEFYRENKERFRLPERAKAVVFTAESQRQAKQIAKELRSGADWKSVADKYSLKVKERVYRNTVKDPVGALIFTVAGGKENSVTVAQMEKNRYVVVKVEKVFPPETIDLEKVKRYIKMRIKAQKLRQAEKELLAELKSKYRVKLLEENLRCLERSAKSTTRL